PPGLDEARGIGLGHGELVDQHDRAAIRPHLVGERHDAIHFDKLQHLTSPAQLLHIDRIGDDDNILSYGPNMSMRNRMGDARAGGLVTELILEVFRLNGRLLAAGDRLVADLGLTSARWQVLGAIALASSPMPVAWIARNM